MNLSLSVSQWEGGSQPASQSQAGWDCMAGTGTGQTAQQLSEPGVWSAVYSNNPRTPHTFTSPSPHTSLGFLLTLEKAWRRPGAPPVCAQLWWCVVEPRLCPPDYFLKRLCQCQCPSSSRCSARPRLEPHGHGVC